MFACIYHCSAQTRNEKRDTTDPANQGLYLLSHPNGKEFLTRNLLVNSTDVITMESLPREDFLKKHGNQKAAIVLKVFLKPDVQILSLKEIFEKYDIDQKYRKYPIKIDNTEPIDKQSIYASASAIKSVKVETDSKTINIILASEKK